MGGTAVSAPIRWTPRARRIGAYLLDVLAIVAGLVSLAAMLLIAAAVVGALR